MHSAAPWIDFAGLSHPGLRQLRRFQTAARLRMTVRRIATPRRLGLTFMAAVLSVIWLGQAVVGILYRTPADPQRLAVWIPAGFLAYAIWNLLKTVCRKPLEPFEWTPTEREMLIGAPVMRRHLVQYRFNSIISAAAIKALCFSLVMLPDIRFWPLALLGMLLALTFIDLLRMLAEVVVWGLTQRELACLRTVVLTLATGAAFSAVVTAYCLPRGADHHAWPAPFGFAMSIGQALLDLCHTAPGWALMQPFRLFSSVILEQHDLFLAVGKLSLGTVTIFWTAWLLIRVDEFFLRRRNQREQVRFETLPSNVPIAAVSGRTGNVDQNVSVPPRCHGAFSLFWRQMRGMYHYRHSLALSFILPGFLSLLPLLGTANEFNLILQIVGSLIFYSFVLLPSALRFDFRRDVERLAVIKALPITPAWATLGQLAGPVLVCSLFQITALLIAMAFHPYHPVMFFVAVTILLPVNALIFCIENLIFMLFPYRVNQEGISVFLRSILTFTAKGILFLMALLLTLGMAGMAASLASHMSFGSYQARLVTVFTMSMWLVLLVSTGVAFRLLATVYRRFDPSQDTPAMS